MRTATDSDSYTPYILILLCLVGLLIAGALGGIAYILYNIDQRMASGFRPHITVQPPRINLPAAPASTEITFGQRIPNPYGNPASADPNVLNIWNSFTEDYQFAVMPEAGGHRIFILHQFDVYVDKYNAEYQRKVDVVAQGLRKVLVMSVYIDARGEVVREKSWEFDLYHDLLADNFLESFAKPELWPYYVRQAREANDQE